MASFGSRDANVHIANHLDRPIYVLVTPNSDWVWADVVAIVLETVAAEVATAGAATAVVASKGLGVARTVRSAQQLGAALRDLAKLKSLSALKRAASLASELQEVAAASAIYRAYALKGEIEDAYEKLKLLATAVATSLPSSRDLDAWNNKIKGFFGDKCKIEPGAVERVATDEFLAAWRGLEPSYWGSMAGASTVHIMVVDEALEYFADFNSGSDDSWVVAPEAVIRSKYGTLWERDAGAGFHPWPSTETQGFPLLRMGQALYSGDEVRSPGGGTRLALEANGDLTLTVADAGETHRAKLCATGRPGRSPARAYVDARGSLTLHNANGSIMWSSSSHGAVRWAPGDDYVLLVLDGGNLLIQGQGGRVVWSSNTRPCRSNKVLEAGQGLFPGQSIQSEGGVYELAYDRTEGFVLRHLASGRVIWRPDVPAGGWVSLGTDGRLIGHCNAVGWASPDFGAALGQHEGCQLRVRDDGDVEVRARDGSVLWTSGTSPEEAVRSGADALLVGQFIAPNGFLQSPNGRYRLAFSQRSSDRWELALEAMPEGTVLWQREVFTSFAGVGRFLLSHTGDLHYINAAGETTWSLSNLGARTGGAHQYDAARLAVRDDGNLVLDAGDGQPLWQSCTSRAEAGAAALESQQQLARGRWLQSANGQFRLTLTERGALVLTRQDNGRALWSTPASADAVELVMQLDGVAAVCAPGRRVVWKTEVLPKPSRQSRLKLQDDGNLVMLSASDRVIWATDTAPAPAEGDALLPGQSLYPGASLRSKSGRYRLDFTADGALEFVEMPERLVWWSTPQAGASARATMTCEGEFVVYGSCLQRAWQSSGGQSGDASRLSVQDNGNLAVTTPWGPARWTAPLPRIPAAPPAAGATLPPPWRTRDVGTAWSAGSARHDHERFVVDGGGGEIGGKADGFRYVYQSVRGNFDLRARVLGVTSGLTGARAGVMIRDSLDADSRHVTVSVTPDAGASLRWRDPAGGATNEADVDGKVRAPTWVRLVRIKDSFTGYVSADGGVWKSLGDVTMKLPAGAYAGIAVASANPAALNTSTFGGVSFQPLPDDAALERVVVTQPASTLPAPWQSQDIGPVGGPGSARRDKEVFRISGCGEAPREGLQGIHYLHQPVEGDFEIRARVAATSHDVSKTLSGVMFRESLDANSKSVALLVPDLSTVRFTAREDGRSTDYHAMSLPKAPAWLRLLRRGDTFSAYASTDGVDWLSLDAVTIAMKTGVHVGLAVGGRDRAVINVTDFDHVTAQRPAAEPSSLPAPWRSDDLGPNSAPGVVTHDFRGFKVANISASNEEACTFVHQLVTGDFELEASIAYAPHSGGGTGLTMRPTLDARGVRATLTFSNYESLRFQGVCAKGEAMTVIRGASRESMPIQLRLTRRGNVLTAHQSKGWGQWTLLGSMTFPNLPERTFVGLTFTGGNREGSSATFSDVKLSQPPPST